MEITEAVRPRWVVAVDLLPLRPAGENGGLKPALFTLMRAVAAEAEHSLAFVFLTNSASHGQVRDLARPQDILICVLEDTTHPYLQLRAEPAAEFKIAPPPPDFIRTIEADLLYCPFGATTFHAPGIPTIALIADLLHKDYPFSLTQAEISHRENYIRNTLSVAAKIQCISRTGMERLMEHYQVPRQKLFYTYLPIHIRLDQVLDNSSAAAEFGSMRPFFFYPANLWLHKNHELLLLSFARYLHEAGEAAWDLVLTFQEDDRADYLRSIAQTLGISDHVHFAGFVTEQELRRLWQNAGALVFPSLHEGFGIPLLEAMHYGVPIISDDGFSLKEVAGDACRLVDARKPASLAAALLEVSTNNEVRAALIKRGHERLKLFDLQGAARCLLKAFHSVMRTEDDFPRRPTYCNQAPVLTTATPASAERWNILVEFEPTKSLGRFSVYLDDLPFATFKANARSRGDFSFFCRPEGRMLDLRLDENNTNGSAQSHAEDDSVRRIFATDARNRRILLYEKSSACGSP